MPRPSTHFCINRYGIRAHYFAAAAAVVWTIVDKPTDTFDNARSYDSELANGISNTKPFMGMTKRKMPKIEMRIVCFSIVVDTVFICSPWTPWPHWLNGNE